MKVVPFKIPRSGEEGIRVQVDEVPHLYNHLHQHPEIQLTLICKSSGTLIAGDYVGRFGEGDVFIIGSNQPHVFRNDDIFFENRLGAKAITVFIDEVTLGNRFWQLAEVKTIIPFFRNSQGGYRIHGRKEQLLREGLIRIATAEGLDKLIQFIQILKILSSKRDMNCLSNTTQQRPIKDFDGSRLNRVFEFTFREYVRIIRLNEIAGVANMTKEAFCKYFKTRTGKTYHNFLNEIRISHACKRLLSPDNPVTSICYEVGFVNLSNFNRVFKKITGKTPKEYREIV